MCHVSESGDECCVVAIGGDEYDDEVFVGCGSFVRVVHDGFVDFFGFVSL